MSIIRSSLLLGAPAGAATYSIPRSLRFNSSDSAYLSRTPASAGNTTTYTFSCWVKRAALGARQMILSATNGINSDSLYFFEDDTLRFYQNDGLSSSLITTQVFRDVSAWYHIVVGVDTTQGTSSNRIKLYVNGSQITTFNTSSYPSSSYSGGINNTVAHNIGRRPTGADNYLSAYLADCFLIDGQQLTPTSFGAFDATTGVWNPSAYSGSYGTNGFHLPFSDNSAATATTLGKDTSGNGNNWTPNNLSVGGTDYNSRVSATATGGIHGSYPLSNAFDNDLNTYCSSATAGSSEGAVSLSFDFTSVPVTVASTVRVYFNAGSSGIPNCRKARINGGSYTANGSTDYAQFSFTGTLTSIDSTLGPGVGGGFTATIAAIEVDGVRLVSASPAGNDSLVDSPTNGTASSGGDAGGTVVGNYATLNPLQKGSSITLSNGNLDSSQSADSAVLATIGVSSGKWYWETTMTGGSLWMTGLARMENGAPNYVGGTSNSYGYYTNGQKWTNSTGSTYGASYTNGDVIGTAFDADNGTLVFYKNGVTQGTAFTGLTSGPYAPAIGNGSTQCSANFGQRPFAYAAPAGFKSLNTANLPTPTILAGNTAFDTKLYTGNGSTQTISGLGFSPDFVWIKDRTAAYSHQLYDQIRGINQKLSSNTTDAETTTSNSVTAFNSDGFNLGSYASVNGNTDAYAAWCWDAGSSNVTNTAGSITSTVRANPSAGFSVVTYTGSGSNATVGHGLGVAPQMVIVKSRSISGSDWKVYHVSTGATQRLNLDTTDAAAANSTVWNNTAPTSTVFSIGTNSDVGQSSATYVAYCWAPLVGYSSFGSYTGNGSTDGPFVYTGFRPKFVLARCSSGVADWWIFDSSRGAYNVNNAGLRPNSSAAETTLTFFDFLSNGFKVRNTGTDLNANGGTHIYMALAENPFSIARAQ